MRAVRRGEEKRRGEGKKRRRVVQMEKRGGEERWKVVRSCGEERRGGEAVQHFYLQRGWHVLQ